LDADPDGAIRLIERQAADATSYARLRTFLDDEQLASRRLTAEWLAGRLILPLGECARVLDRMAGEGILRRHYGREEGLPWFEIVPLPERRDLSHVFLAVVIVAASVSVVALGAILHHVFFFAVGLALGLLIAFAWLDWELRSRA
jgi:hypothetical protein